jgi:hypothetical protein
MKQRLYIECLEGIVKTIDREKFPECVQSIENTISLMKENKTSCAEGDKLYSFFKKKAHEGIGNDHAHASQCLWISWLLLMKFTWDRDDDIPLNMLWIIDNYKDKFSDYVIQQTADMER